MICNWTNNVFCNSWIPWNFQNTLLSVAKDVHLNNHSKTTRYAQNYLLNCFIVCVLYYSFKILPAKPHGLFIFVRVSMSHTHFLNDKICISWVPNEAQYSVFQL